MKRTLTLAALVLTCTSALDGRPCEELKAEIATRIEANNVKSYTLDIVPNEQAAEDKLGQGKVVGSCDGGTKKIVYTRK